MVDKFCKDCGKKLSAIRYIRCNPCNFKFQQTKILINCDTCGISYFIHLFRLKDYKQHFCSWSCKINSKQVKKLHLLNPKPFIKNQLPWNKGKTWDEKVRKKISRALVGKLVGSRNPSWKGGITSFTQKLKRLTEYKYWFSNVLKRDKFTCRKCIQYNPGPITAHHLKSLSYLLRISNPQTLQEAKELKELWDLNNGVTLCRPCHKLTPNYGTKALVCPIDTTVYSL